MSRFVDSSAKSAANYSRGPGNSGMTLRCFALRMTSARHAAFCSFLSLNAAEWLGMESEFAAIPYDTLRLRLSEAAPALVRVAGPGDSRFVVILRGSRRSIWLLSPNSLVVRYRADEVADFLTVGHSDSLKP